MMGKILMGKVLAAYKMRRNFSCIRLNFEQQKLIDEALTVGSRGGVG